MNALGGPHRGQATGLRLALFSGNYNYTRDGANQALNRLVAWLLDEGAAVRVYSPTSRTPAFEPAGELVSATSIPIPGRTEYRLGLPLSRRLCDDVAAFAPTVIHLSAPDLLGLSAQRLARRLGVPVVSSLHTRFETYLSYYRLGWLRPALERKLDAFYAGCDCVLAPNAPIAELLRRASPGTAVRIWSRGVDRSRFSPAARDPTWRRGIGLADDDVAVLFLGRLVHEKGLDIYAATFEALADCPHVRPLVVGDGPAAAWLRQRLPGAVFTGFLVGEELGRAVSSADVLFNPSVTEAFGNATLEGLAAGLPAVCPQAPSTLELVASGREGLLVANPSPAEYALALRALAQDPELRARLGNAARERSRAFQWDASCGAVLEAYRAVTEAEPLDEARSVRPARVGA